MRREFYLPYNEQLTKYPTDCPNNNRIRIILRNEKNAIGRHKHLLLINKTKKLINLKLEILRMNEVRQLKLNPFPLF